MTWAIEEGGGDAMRARYVEFREQYYGRGTLDFGEGTLTAVAQNLGRSNPEAGKAAIKLNLEHFPESLSTWMLKGQLHLLVDEKADANARSGQYFQRGSTIRRVYTVDPIQLAHSDLE